MTFATAQLQLGRSIRERLANAVLRVGGLSASGNFRLLTRMDAMGLPVRSTSAEFIAAAADVAFASEGASVEVDQDGVVAEWRVRAVDPLHHTGNVLVSLEAEL